MKIRFEEKDRSLIVFIDGEIDHHTSEEIKNKIDKAFDRFNARNIIVNFENVDFMDSSGIGMLIGRYKMLEARGEGGKIYSTNISSAIGRLFDISGLTKIIKCLDNIEDALANI